MEPREPWVLLRELLQAGDFEAVEQELEALDAGDVARAVAHLSADEQRLLLERVSPDDVADFLVQLSRTQVVDLVEQLEPERAAEILHELPTEAGADILKDLDDEDAQQVLAALPPDEAEELREVARWEDDSAGGLMGVEFVAVRASVTMREVVTTLREQADDYLDHEVQYIYVVDDLGRLHGVLPLRVVVLTDDDVLVRERMIPAPMSVPASLPLDDLAEIFDGIRFYGLPVVDEDGELVGVVRRAAVMEAVGEQAAQDNLKAAGIIDGDELRSMELSVRAGGRLKWLSLNVLLNIVAASVIAYFQDTLQSVVALAVFLPIISDMSGCSGNQAVAVSMRELSLGVATPADLLHVLGKELAVGLVNGSSLGLLLGLVGWLWMGNPWLGLVAGAALAANTLIAVSIGGTVPLLAKRFGVDPALASGPVLTTITDVCGFALVLGIATMLLDRLV
ncbi:MAG: magnesium transporter [Myxococcota bacterium]